MNIIQTVYSENGSDISKLAQDFAYDNPELTDQEIIDKFGQEITYEMMKNCPNYIRITLFNSKPLPKLTPLVEKVGKETNDILVERIKTEKISNNLVGEILTQINNK